MSDVSSLPVAFLTEIQQDQVYGTILKELKKKMPDQTAFNAVAAVEQRLVEEHLRSLSPHLLALPDKADEDDDDGSSVSDDESPAPDGYDTDIEAGLLSLPIHKRPAASSSFRGGHKKRSRSNG